MRGSLKIAVSILIIVLFFSEALSQDYHEMAKRFIRQKMEKMNCDAGDLNFIQIEKGNLILMEGIYPECYVLYINNNGRIELIGYSLDNVFYIDLDRKEKADELLTIFNKSTPKVLLTKSAFKANRIPVGPLCKSKWNQNRLFNRYCPYSIESSADQRTYAGCVAVAMGQLIRYYGKWNDESKMANVFNKDSLEYDICSMLDRPSNYEMEISRFLADIGSQIGMIYGSNMSTTCLGFGWKILEEIGYKYADRAVRNQHDYWLDVIYRNLSEYHPVIIGGSSHAYICDGYDENGMLHFNLGWSGVGDGYFNPSYVGKNMDNFYYSDEVIIDAFPPEYQDQPAPRAIGINNDDSNPFIYWLSPGRNDVLNYRLYYSDNDYFDVSELNIRIKNLKPGTHGIKVSAVYPDGESIWIGPVWVHNPGEEVAVNEEIGKAIAYAQGIMDKAAYETVKTEGFLSDFKTIDIKDPVSSLDFLALMPNLQSLGLNCEKLEIDDFDRLYGLASLQTLKLYNYKVDELPDFRLLPKLVELILRKPACLSLDNLRYVKHLLSLEIYESQSEAKLPPDLTDLERLAILNTKIASVSFLEKCSKLRELIMNGCGLESINLEELKPILTSVNLNNNKLKDTRFITNFPNLTDFSAENNELESLDLTARLPELERIIVSNNNIKRIISNQEYENFETLVLSDNELSRIPGLYNMPNLKTLNLTNNKIYELKCNVNTNLSVLNLSGNRLTHLDGLEDFFGLAKFIAKDNYFSDISPLANNKLSRSLKHVDIRNNPLSKQSLEEILPELRDKIAIIYAPAEYTPGSPCYPTVSTPGRFVKTKKVLEWYTESKIPDNGFDLYLGIGDSMRIYKSELGTESVEVELDRGNVYSWMVKANYSDTCFYSGLYRIEDLDESGIDLPYSEDFETYYYDDEISRVSPYWRLANGGKDGDNGAYIAENQEAEAGNKLLKLVQKTDINLDLSHLDAAYLKIELDQFVIAGKTAVMSLKDIQGLSLDVITDGYSSELYLNESYLLSFEVRQNSWNHYKIILKGRDGCIWFFCNGDIVFREKKDFTDNILSVGFLGFGPIGFETISHFPEYTSYVDNITITDGRKSSSIVMDSFLSVSETKAFPNPADTYVNFEGIPETGNNVVISLVTTSGQLVLREKLSVSAGRARIELAEVPQGMYIYQISGMTTPPVSGRIVVKR